MYDANLGHRESDYSKGKQEWKVRPAERDPGQPWKTSWLRTVT